VRGRWKNVLLFEKSNNHGMFNTRLILATMKIIKVVNLINGIFSDFSNKTVWRELYLLDSDWVSTLVSSSLLSQVLILKTVLLFR
jgi:hypothetical protein